MFTIYVIEFLLFSFVGWVIDSGYRSFVDRKWINVGYFRGPLCPIYGLGGVVLVFIFNSFSFLSPLILWLVAAMGMVIVEFIGGVFSEKVLKIKLWDYSDAKWHFAGHIDLLHSLYWLLLAILFGVFIFPLVQLLESIIIIPEFLDMPIFLLFLIFFISVTIRKDPSRYLDIHRKFANISVLQYQKIYSNIKKMRKAKSVKIRLHLQAIIEKQLQNTGAYLKKIKINR